MSTTHIHSRVKKSKAKIIEILIEQWMFGIRNRLKIGARCKLNTEIGY